MYLKKEIVIPSKTESIRVVERFIDEVCEIVDFNEDLYGNILIAVTEGVNNAISHGNNYSEEKNVRVSFENKKESFVFEIEDEGPGFDFNTTYDPTDPKNIENPHGRGIFLMKNLSNELEFKEEGRLVVISFFNVLHPIN